MNGNFPRHPRDDADDEDLDPGLMQLFDAAKANPPSAARNANGRPRSRHPTGDAFVAAVLLRMQQTRRLRLLRQIAGLTLVLVATALLAPYVARQTFVIADWFTNQLPATGMALMSSIGCLCGALFSWGVARRARNS